MRNKALRIAWQHHENCSNNLLHIVPGNTLLFVSIINIRFHECYRSQVFLLFTSKAAQQKNHSRTHLQATHNAASRCLSVPACLADGSIHRSTGSCLTTHSLGVVEGGDIIGITIYKKYETSRTLQTACVSQCARRYPVRCVPCRSNTEKRAPTGLGCEGRCSKAGALALPRRTFARGDIAKQQQQQQPKGVFGDGVF